MLKSYIFPQKKSNKNQHSCIQMYSFIKTEFSNRNMFCQKKKKYLSIFDIDCLGKKLTLIIDLLTKQVIQLNTVFLLV